MEWVGRCYNQHGRCYSLGLVYFNLSSVMLFRTLSHICGRWYLPMFLFRDGLLTLMNIVSLISLVRFKNTCKKYGIQVHFKGGKTIRNLLVAPKDKVHITQKSGIIYRFKCDWVECDEEYIGESARTFGERFKEHLKHPSPIYDHSTITGHSITLDNFSIVGERGTIH